MFSKREKITTMMFGYLFENKKKKKAKKKTDEEKKTEIP
jgi:hypothetical protein